MISLTIELTDQCYNECKHCSSNAEIYCSKYLSTAKVFEIIKDAKRLNLDNIYFSGGEPFLHNDLHDIVQYAASQCGVDVGIYTSGITKDQYGDPISIGIRNLSDLKDRGLSKIIIGLNSLDKNIYSKFCQNSNNFDIVMKSIDNATDVFLNSVELNIVPNKYNIEEITKFIPFACSKGIGRINFLGLVIHGRADKYVDELYLSLSEHKELMGYLDTLHRSFPTLIRIGNPLMCGSCSKCTCGVNKLVITSSGLVYGCESMKNIQYLKTEFGEKVYPDSIYDKSLSEIYHSSEYLKEEKRLLSSYAKKFDGEIQSICPIQRAMWN